MALNYVTVILDVYDGQGNAPESGTASFTPSAVLTSAGVAMIGQMPVGAAFRPGPLPAVSLLATDNAGITPSPWTWAVAFSGVPAKAFSFSLPYNGGAGRLLSSLAP